MRGTKSRFRLPGAVILAGAALAALAPVATAAPVASEAYVLTLPGVAKTEAQAPDPDLGSGETPGVGGVSGDRQRAGTDLGAVASAAGSAPVLVLLAVLGLRAAAVRLGARRPAG